ncbi:hypothetical protein PT974_11355 [Cladobotryum mycophilum]|uniref:Uncharacterized protein n=1 Tax=Cladobotryum mycophilum TaxID=491253 RepID=A0ABR0S6B9_9HYPO
MKFAIASSLFILAFLALIDQARGLIPMTLHMPKKGPLAAPPGFVPINMTYEAYQDMKQHLPANTSFVFCPSNGSACVEFKNATELESSPFWAARTRKRGRYPFTTIRTWCLG